MKDVDFDRLGNNFGNEKSKNDSYPSGSYYTPKERGGCLSLFLGFAFLGNLFFLLYYLVTFSEFRGALDAGWSILLFGIFAIQVGIFVSVVALWNWKQWGYNGLMAGYVLNIVLSLLTGAFTSITGSVIGIAILYYLMKDKIHLLD